VRARVGTGGAREARRHGFVPGVLYGGELAPVAINLKKSEVLKAVETGTLPAEIQSHSAVQALREHSDNSVRETARRVLQPNGN